MPRTTLMVALPLACALWLAAPLLAQNSGAYTTPVGPGIVYAPEIHLGSAAQPSTITAPSIQEVPANPPEPYISNSNAPPASTALLATRHFDYITSPLDGVVPGSMADTSISLGEYARQLRAEKQKPLSPAVPNAIASPTNSPDWK